MVDSNARRGSGYFIHRENIKLYRQRLAEATSEQHRAIIKKLLAEEEAKDQVETERKKA